MKTQIEWAELHAPLFLSGTNLGMKLDPKLRKGLSMEYDENRGHLYVSFNGKTARVPGSSVLTLVETTEPVVKAVEPVKAVTLHSTAVTAQVETPMSHVHAGPGKGKKGQGKAK